MPLVIEYFATASRAIRDSNDKLEIDKNGLPHGWYACAKECLAEIGFQIKQELYHLGQVCHRAIGIDYYGIYDVRVGGEGEVWFVEQSLYCLFTPKIILVTVGDETKPVISTITVVVFISSFRIFVLLPFPSQHSVIPLLLFHRAFQTISV